ncbi:MAG: hypothetical protein V4603_17025 [Pseudomonadota bacterium]
MKKPTRKLLAICVATCALQGNFTLAADTTFAPSFSVAAVHDDNVFISDSGNPASDTFIRYTPGLTLDYNGDTLKLTGNYKQDGEKYQDNTQLDTNAARRIGNVSARWILTDRFSFDLGGQYLNTPTPGELNILTGFQQLGRLRSKREAVNTGVQYRFSPTLFSALSYSVSHDSAQTISDIKTHEANLDITKDWSERLQLLFGHSYREYRFDDGSTLDTHTPTVGFAYDLTRQTTLRVEAGPRIFGDSDTVKPQIDVNVRHEYTTTGLLEVGYTRSETVLTGINDRVESETLSGSFTKDIGRNWNFSVRPSYGTVRNAGNKAKVSRFVADLRYNLTNYWYVNASYQYTRQQDSFAANFNRVIPRNVILVGINFSYPIRNGEQSQTR